MRYNDIIIPLHIYMVYRQRQLVVWIDQWVLWCRFGRLELVGVVGWLVSIGWFVFDWIG